MHIASIGIDLNKTTAEQHSLGTARQLVGDRDHDLSPRCPRSAEQGSYAHNPRRMPIRVRYVEPC